MTYTHPSEGERWHGEIEGMFCRLLPWHLQRDGKYMYRTSESPIGEVARRTTGESGAPDGKPIRVTTTK